MTTGVFIKTCLKDLCWLRFCLESISRFGSRFESVVIVADSDCRKEMDKLPQIGQEVVFVEMWANGYIQQQWVKINADQYTGVDQVLFVDSDCVFHTDFFPESFTQDGKPVLLKTRYSELLQSEGGRAALKWKRITQGIVGWDVEWEYMRRLPTMIHSSTLASFRKMIPGLKSQLMALEFHDFSEFNAIGAFIEKHEPEKYFITDTSVWIPNAVAEQFWSWGGLTQQIKSKIEGYLR